MGKATLYKAFGKELSLQEWTAEPECATSSRRTLVSRLAAGMSIEEALTKGTEKLYSAFGETKSFASWQKDPRFTAKERTARTRMAAGWDFERCISEPAEVTETHLAFGEEKTLTDWVKDPRCVVGLSELCKRVKQGRPLELALTEKIEAQLYEAFGENKTINAWVRDPRCVAADYRVLLKRIKSGMTVEQALTRYIGKRYLAFGELKSYAEWLEDPRCIVNAKELRHRMQTWNIQDGDSIERAITEPIKEIKLYEAFGEKKNLSEWTRDDRSLVKAPTSLNHRLNNLGMPLEQALVTPLSSFDSMGEVQLADWIEELGLTIERNNRTIIKPLELDIFIPDKMIAIEFNGCYWHSEIYRDKNYHYNKWKACQAIGIRLIQVWEDDWTYRQDVAKNMLSNRLGVSNQQSVYARKTQIDKAPHREEVRELLDANHIQGFTGSSECYGLRFEGRLIAILLLKKLGNEDEDWDLVRYATSCNIPGGFTKLLKAFRNDHPGSIKTFADLSWSNGDLYHQTGFNMVKRLEPDYSYIIKSDPQRMHKFGFRKNVFKTDPNLKYDPAMTEAELAQLNGLIRVYDSGKLKFVLK